MEEPREIDGKGVLVPRLERSERVGTDTLSVEKVKVYFEFVPDTHMGKVYFENTDRHDGKLIQLAYRKVNEKMRAERFPLVKWKYFEVITSSNGSMYCEFPLKKKYVPSVFGRPNSTEIRLLELNTPAVKERIIHND
jgi:hypothetical protein